MEYLLGTQEEWRHECPNCHEFHSLSVDDMICDFDEQKDLAGNKIVLVKSVKWRCPDCGLEFSEREVKNAAQKYFALNESARAQLLTCGVDVQANRLHYLIMGHAPQELFGIKYGVIWGKPTDSRTWQQLDEVFGKNYSKADGSGLKVARLFIDSGFATDLVYDYCRSRNGTFPVKGTGTVGTGLISNYSPQREKGVMLVVLGVNDGKAQVFSRLDKIHFGKDDAMERGFDATFFKELTSEHAVLKKSGGRLIEVFEKIGKHSRNEALDCMVYALAAAKSLIGDDEATFYQKLLQPEKKPPAKKIFQRTLEIW